MRKKRLLKLVEALTRELIELREQAERPQVQVCPQRRDCPYLPAYDMPTPTMPDVVIPSIWDTGTWIPRGTITTNIKYNDQVLWATPDGCDWYVEYLDWPGMHDAT